MYGPGLSRHLCANALEVLEDKSHENVTICKRVFFFSPSRRCCEQMLVHGMHHSYTCNDTRRRFVILPRLHLPLPSSSQRAWHTYGQPTSIACTARASTLDQEICTNPVPGQAATTTTKRSYEPKRSCTRHVRLTLARSLGSDVA